MTRIGCIFAGLVCCAIILTAAPPDAASDDRAAVEAVIRTAYVEAIHNGGDLEAARQGFHPGFAMLILRDDSLATLPIHTWLETAERTRRQNPTAVPPRTEADFLSIDITGDAATVKLTLSREGRLIFTDYLMLYRFAAGWRIVGKTFHRHP